MRRRPAQILVILLVLVFVIGAAGCGSSKKNTTSTTTTTTTAAAATTAATTTTTAAAATTTAGAATTPAANTGGLGALGSSSNCAQLLGLGSTIGQAFAGTAGDPSKEAALLQQFADKAPAAVKADFQTIADAMAKVAVALKGVNLKSGTPDPAALAKLAALSSQLNVQALTTAAHNIAAWAGTNCHP
jgi:hypothetical protein